MIEQPHELQPPPSESASGADGRTTAKPASQQQAPYRAALALGFFLAFLASAFALGLLGVSAWFLAASGLAALVPASASGFNTLVPSGFIRLFALGRTAFRYGERLTSHDATFGMLADLRTSVYSRIKSKSPSKLGGLHTGELLSRMTRDIDSISDRYIRLAIPTSSSAALLLVAVLASAFALPQILPGLLVFSGFSLVISPALAFFLGQRTSGQAVRARSLLGRHVVDSIDAAQDLALHAPSLAKNSDNFEKLSQTGARSSALLGRLGAFLQSLLLIASGAFGIWAFLTLESSALFALEGAAAAAILVLCFAIYDIVSGLPQTWALGGISSGARSRVQSVLGSPLANAPKPATTRAAQPAKSAQPSPRLGPVPNLELKNLSFAYDTPLFADLDMNIQAGEHAILAGPSGSGKSTLLSLLAGLEEPNSGQVILDGHDIRQLPEQILRDTIALALQEPWLANDSLAANLRLAAPNADKERLWEVLELVGLAKQVRSWPNGLETWIAEGGRSLSGGQRRRLNVARTLLRRSPITLLDEPAEGLSDNEASAMYRGIRAALEGKTLIVAAHRAADQAEFSKVLRLSQ